MNKEQFQTIDKYIKIFPKDIQIVLGKIRKIIKETAPEATEAISYQMPTFKLRGKNLVHFAAFKSHIGFYPTPSGTDKFKKEISIFKSGKGSIQFPLTEEIPYDLIQKIVKFRVKENERK